MITIYGIKNCDTMKKAFKWLNEHHIDYHFHNYKTDGLTATLLQDLLNKVDWQVLLNTRGSTWRKLDESIRQHVTNQEAAKTIMLQNTSIIKRPIIVKDNKILVGFSTDLYQQFFEN